MIHGIRTSMRLEAQLWSALAELCRRETLSLHQACTLMKDSSHPSQSLTSAVRMHVLGYYSRAVTEEGHRIAGHGTGAATIRTALLAPGGTHKDGLVGRDDAVLDGLEHGRDAVRDAKLA